MLIERLYDDDLAQASYLIGCQASGEAIVVDPRRDIGDYLRLAESNGLRIVAVTETHIHADYLSGTRELAEWTGARMYVSGEGGPDGQYGAGFDDAERLVDGDEIRLGKVVVTARHTPGHTPEHLSFLVTDGARAGSPGYLLSGDFVFVGDVGRPDLLDEAAGGVGTRFAGARDLFESLRRVFLTLPDYVQVLPAHGSGSACGKSLGAIAATTVGYERAFSWWAPYLESGDEEGFVREILDGQPDAHAYFARMKRQNREGPDLLGALPVLEEYTAEALRPLIERGDVVFVDTRHHDLVHRGTVSGSLNIPGPDTAARYGGWAYDPDADRTPLVVLADSRVEADEVRDHLVRVGIDRVGGFIRSLDGLDLIRPSLVRPESLKVTDRRMLLDVRNGTEFASGHIPGATRVSAGRALWTRAELPQDGAIVSYCRSGARNSVVASALRRSGFDVVELDGSYLAWAAVPGNVPATTAAASI